MSQDEAQVQREKDWILKEQYRSRLSEEERSRLRKDESVDAFFAGFNKNRSNWIHNK